MQKAWTKVQRVQTFHSKSRKRECNQKSERNPEFSLPWFALSHVSKLGKVEMSRRKSENWMKTKLLIFSKMSS